VWLVPLDDDHVGGVLGGDQQLRVLALAVECVGGDHRAGQLQRPQQRRERGDLVALALDGDLAKHGGGVMAHRRQQMHRRVGVVAAAAQGLAVHGHGRPQLPWRRRPGRRRRRHR
jgi:hypothetical protein